jgi:hypothetical protein
LIFLFRLESNLDYRYQVLPIWFVPILGTSVRLSRPVQLMGSHLFIGRTCHAHLPVRIVSHWRFLAFESLPLLCTTPFTTHVWR